MKRHQSTFEKTLLTIIKTGIFLLLFAPLVVNRNFFFPFVSPKGFYIMALSEIIIAAFLILILFFPKYRPSFNRVIMGITLFIFALFLSTIFSVSFLKSFFSNCERMTGFLFYLHLFGLIFVFVSVLEKKDWMRIFFASILIATIVSLIELVTRFFKEDLFSFTARGGSTLGNSSFFATYLLFNIFFAIYLMALSCRKKRLFFPIFFLLFFLCVSLFLSGGRAASYSFCIGAFLIFLFYISFCWSNSKIKFLGKIALLITLFAIIFGIILLCIPGSIFQNQLAKLSSKARPLAWQMALKGAKERPFFGWGLQNFDLVFARYFNPCFFLKECGGEIWFDRAHNVIFDTLIESGIFGLLAYLLIYFFSFGILWKRYFKEKTKEDFWKASVFTSLLVAYFLQNLTVFDMPISLLFFFLTLGFVASSLKEPEKTQGPEKSSSIKFFMGFLILFLFSFSFLKFIILPAEASYLFIKDISLSDSKERMGLFEKISKMTPFSIYQMRVYLAKTYLFLASKKQASKEEGEFIAEELEKTQKEIPSDLKTSLLLSDIYLILARDFNENTIKKAEENAEKAIKISSQNQQGYWLLAEIKLSKGDCKTAFSLAKYAYDLEPRAQTSLSVLSKVWNICKDKLPSKEQGKSF